MNGAREYAKVFEDGQHGRLYFTTGSHARGSTFRIHVLPEGEKAIIKYTGHPPSNKDAVEVYGILGGLNGWTEYYGWIHKGGWQNDFNKIYEEKLVKIAERALARSEKLKQEKVAENNRKNNLLEGY